MLLIIKVTIELLNIIKILTIIPNIPAVFSPFMAKLIPNPKKNNNC